MEQKLHFIGIGGIGMSAIARIMLGMGFQISGSDVRSTPLTESLAAAGARIVLGHQAANLPADCQAVVYSSAIKADNPELQEAAKRRLPIYKRAEMLAFLMSTKTSIGVAGSHGKTTVSGMIATMLEFAGQDPTFIIGGMLPALGGGNAKAGAGPYLVAEADESDGTFLMLHPTVAVVTNIESDHLDHYGDLTKIIEAFAVYLRQVPEQGFAVVCSDCPAVKKLAQEIPGRYIRYSLHDDSADFVARQIRHQGRFATAEVYQQGRLLGELRLQVPGAHNIANGLAAIATGISLGLPFAACAEALQHFTGTGRRFEHLGTVEEITVIDDYAHHPTEIKATIAAAREAGFAQVTAVFQPHRYTRTRDMVQEFAEALVTADKVLISEIYPAFEKPIEGVSAQLIVDAARKSGHNSVLYAADLDQALTVLMRETGRDDLLLIMGAGNIRSLGESFVEAKRRKHGE